MLHPRMLGGTINRRVKCKASTETGPAMAEVEVVMKLAKICNRNNDTTSLINLIEVHPNDQQDITSRPCLVHLHI